MARCDVSDAEWRIIEGLLPTERGKKPRPLTIIDDTSTEDCMFSRSVDLSATCMGAVVSGIPPMCASAAGLRKACRVLPFRRVSNWG